jgi:hypothetical protein
LFPSIYIDAKNCQPLITAWSSYHREWIEKDGVYDHFPAKDKSSHYADAGRYLTVAVNKIRGSAETTREQWRKLKEKYG